MSQKVGNCGTTMKNCAAMTTLDSPKLVENKFSRTSRLSRLVLRKKLSRVGSSKVKSIRRVASNSILRLQTYICVQPTFDAKLPLAHKELLYEVPSLRVTSVCLGGEMRQHRRFCDFGVHWGQERPLFSKISSFSNFPPAP